MFKKTIKVLCVATLLVLSALGLLACTKEQAKDESDAVKRCVESQKYIDCAVSAHFDCDAEGCSVDEKIARALQCLKVCSGSDAGVGGTSGAAGIGGFDAR